MAINMFCLFLGTAAGKPFVNFQRKHSYGSTFLNKVAGYLALPGNVLLENLWNIHSSFYKKHPKMAVTEVTVFVLTMLKLLNFQITINNYHYDIYLSLIFLNY